MKRNRMKRISVASRLSRREVLGFLGGAAAMSVAGCFRSQAASGKPTGTSTTPNQTPTPTAIASSLPPTCVVKPQQTEGPYFVDEKLNRSDIRSDPSNGSVKQGVSLRLVFRVSAIAGRSCQPLAGAVVDIWHCDASGVYSDVTDRSFSTVGQKFLRGYQVTDANGMAEFVTIYPGWYPGRTVHIHFKIRTDSASEQGHEFTSQLYFDDAITDQVYAQPPYADQGQRSTRNERDGIFGDGGEQLMLQLSQEAAAKEAQGYVGRFDLGLQVA
ncbi:MAG TPA: intradiol ring-cleavage dioxygenase [Candidatus Obscuribacterales bacterium]